MANKYLNFDGLSHLIDKLKASIAKKVDKEEGKTLSSNDFTTAEKTKLNGIAEGANNYTLPSAGADLGGVKSGGDVTISGGVITVNDDSHNHTIANVDGLQDALDGKSDDGHTHNYAGSSTVGGSANSAVKLDSSAGSETQPVYFSNGKPVATTYTLEKSVPSDAKFTDTVYTLPSAGTSLGGVKSGGDVTISDGVITVNDDSHNHTIANVDGLQTVLDGKETSGAAATALTNAKSYTDGEVDAATELLQEEIETKANSSDLTSHVNNKSNPHGVTAAQVGADPTGTAESAVSSHNTNTEAHSDIRDSIEWLTTVFNALADSDDETLDQLSEIVAYIKSNKSLIDSITTSKVNVSDIVDNLTTNISNKPLSAAQGVALKALIDAINTSLAEKGSGDMLKSVYDTDGDGIVDNAEKLGGQLPSYYAAASAIPTKTSQLTNDSGFKTTDTTYNQATSSVLGLVKIGYSENGKNYPVELNTSGQMFVNVPWTDNNTVYTHPTYTAKSSGLYKITVDSTGHVSGTEAVTKSDITALGIPAQDTTYTLSSFGINATATELNYVDGVTSNIQTQINALIARIAALEAAVGFSTDESDM